MEKYTVFMDQRINIVEMSIVSKGNYTFNAITYLPKKAYLTVQFSHSVVSDSL